MKKIFALALVVSILGVFAAGCSGGAAEEPKADTPKTETPKEDGH